MWASKQVLEGKFCSSPKELPEHHSSCTTTWFSRYSADLLIWTNCNVDICLISFLSVDTFVSLPFLFFFINGRLMQDFCMFRMIFHNLFTVYEWKHCIFIAHSAQALHLGKYVLHFFLIKTMVNLIDAHIFPNKKDYDQGGNHNFYLIFENIVQQATM